MTLTRRILASSLVGAIALSLSACDSAAESEDALAGEPIAAIPAPEGQAWTDTVNVSEDGGYVLGNPEAPLKLVEYASHTCGACANFSQTGSPALKEDYISSGVVSLELRNLVRDPIDLTIAALVRCGTPEMMIPLSDQAWGSFEDVMTNAQTGLSQVPNLGDIPADQRFVTIAEASGLIDFFAARGLSSDQARTCLADNTTVEAIAAQSQKSAIENEINTTPSFFLNGKRLDASQWNGVEPVLQRAGAR
ncbi:MAG: thioredoxin domain-containing protein [Erythrobacter sp.]